MLTHKISYMATGILLASSLCAVMAYGQAATTSPQPTSLGEAARKVRDQNKGKQPAKVFTNENLGDIKGTVSVVGPEPPAPAATATTPAGDAATPAPAGDAATPAAGTAAPAAAKPEAKGEAYWREKFASARKKLADDSKELDVLQREYNLKEMQFYSNPNVALREQNSRGDLNKTLAEINTKKTDVAKDQEAISSLEDELRRAGGDSGWSRAPSN